MDKPLINILIRTSNRPNFFNRCYQSIREQTYKNIRIVVSYDDDFTNRYVKKYKTDAIIGFNRVDDWSEIRNEVFLPGHISKPFPPNEYFNEMMKLTQPGYIIKLDDDNRFASNDVLQKIVMNISGKDQMLFWRVQFPGYLIPDNQYFGYPPHCCQIDTAGFTFHTDYIRYGTWDKYSLGDYRTAMSLYLHIPKKVYINEVLTALQASPGSGLRNDLEIKETSNYEI